jgi:hypothetical protein
MPQFPKWPLLHVDESPPALPTEADAGVYIIHSGRAARGVYVGESGRLGARWIAHVRDLRTGRHWNPNLRQLFELVGPAGLFFSVVRAGLRNLNDRVFLEAAVWRRYRDLDCALNMIDPLDAYARRMRTRGRAFGRGAAAHAVRERRYRDRRLWEQLDALENLNRLRDRGWIARPGDLDSPDD